MSGQSDFASEELVLRDPDGRDADRHRGRWRDRFDSFSMKADAEARWQLARASCSTRWCRRDRCGSHSARLGRGAGEPGLRRLRDALAAVERRAMLGERGDYTRLLLARAERVACAHKERAEPVSDAERATVEEIEVALAGDR